MNVEDILATFKTLGKPQTAAIYKRHGSGDNVYGVLTSEITKIKKKIKVDHALAMELWNTGNAEARILASLDILTLETLVVFLDKTVRGVQDYSHADVPVPDKCA